MRLRLCILLPLIWDVAPVLTAESSKQGWQLLHQASPLATGSRKQPAIRYSHAAAAWGEEMLVTHGYFYDAENNKPRWLSDTWAMSFKQPHRWRRVVADLDRNKALEAYGRKQTPAAPCGRYGSTAVVVGDQLYLFGGTDGGFHKHGRDGFEQNYDYDELWVLNLKTHKWLFLGSGASGRSAWPSPRHLHGAVAAQNKLLVHGGVGTGLADVWAWDFTKHFWKKLTNASHRTKSTPGGLFAAGYLTVDCRDKHGFIVYGGRPEHGGHEDLSSDVWFFDMDKVHWHRLQLSSDSGPRPSARFYMGFAQLAAGSSPQACSVDLRADSKSAQPRLQGISPMAFMTGASVHTPTMECTDESWSLTWDLDHMLIQWARHEALPFGYYHNTLVAKNNTVYSFGGHLCGETQHLPFRYLNTVQSFDVGRPAPEPRAHQLGYDASARSLDRELKSLH